MDGPHLVACPRCRGGLDVQPSCWTCPRCGARYRALRGIPDLRTDDDVFMTNRDDWSLALRLDAAYDHLDFAGLLEHYYDLNPDVPPDLRRRQVAHIRSAPARARRWLDALRLAPGEGPVLDLGCGSGSFLAATAGDGREYLGVDIALRWLLVARKRLDEAGLVGVRLVCGCAERLPLRGRSFAGVVAGDVIEHVADREATLAEAHRVLRPGGRLFLASPNRFSLAPEPHVGVWGVGYLPRRLMAPYVRRRRGLDFRAIHTLGYGGWRRLLRGSAFGGGSVLAPTIPDEGGTVGGRARRPAIKIYNKIIKFRIGQALARRFGPLFHVVCERPGGSAPRPSRSTRRRSRRPAGRG